MQEYFKNILRDKTGAFSMREVVVAIFVVATLTAWISEQFFSLSCPEYMFYGFVSLIAAGCFGYSIEKRSINPFKTKNENDQVQE
jgi:hypothetical protein